MYGETEKLGDWKDTHGKLESGAIRHTGERRLVLIEVSRGVATFHAPPDIDVYLVDWDNAINGFCLMCGDTTDFDVALCSECQEIYNQFGKGE